MDLSNALLIITAVYGLIELAKAILPDGIKAYRGVVAFLVLLISFGAVFLVGATAWAHEQVIGGVSLDLMSVADKVLVSFLVAGAAVTTDRVVGAVSNIGTPMPTTTMPKGDTSARRG